MASDEPRLGDAHEFYEQHEHLHNVVADIQSTIAEKKVSCSALAASLRELRDFMQAHIVLEETDGYFHEAIAHAPRLKQWADTLRQEHSQLLLLLEQLMDHVEKGGGTEAWWSRVAALYDEFASRQRDHEQNENHLLQEAYTQDTGTGD